jgi:hypothetical protein
MSCVGPPSDEAKIAAAQAAYPIRYDTRRLQIPQAAYPIRYDTRRLQIPEVLTRRSHRTGLAEIGPDAIWRDLALFRHRQRGLQGGN